MCHWSGTLCWQNPFGARWPCLCGNGGSGFESQLPPQQHISMSSSCPSSASGGRQGRQPPFPLLPFSNPCLSTQPEAARPAYGPVGSLHAHAPHQHLSWGAPGWGSELGSAGDDVQEGVALRHLTEGLIPQNSFLWEKCNPVPQRHSSETGQQYHLVDTNGLT